MIGLIKHSYQLNEPYSDFFPNIFANILLYRKCIIFSFCRIVIIEAT